VRRYMRVGMIFLTTIVLLAAGAFKLARGQDNASVREAEPGSESVVANAIGGVVRGTDGTEAGVWVIAETSDLATKFRKIVVTDNMGRFVIPDLPNARYEVWVRGYGLVDSVPVESIPGRYLALNAITAPNPRAAAQVYPANYWFSLVRVPSQTDLLSGSAPIPPIRTAATASAQLVSGIHNQAEWIYAMRGCQHCHQLGDKDTREIEPNLGVFNSSLAAWDRRLMSGQKGPNMQLALSQFPRDRVLAMYANWTDRIAAGEVPPAPPRPQGVERNVVITEWNWAAGPGDWIHDVTSTDRRNPTMNANGVVYGSAAGTHSLVMLDPSTNKPEEIKIPTLQDRKTIPAYASTGVGYPSPYFGETRVWGDLLTSPHNPMMDQKGNVWVTTTIRGTADPAFCGKGSNNPFAENYPLSSNNLQLAVYEPVREKWTLINTCFGTHHLQFAQDKDNTLYLSGQTGALGWINTRVFDETGDAQASQGWCPAFYDSKGSGKYDPKVDKTVAGFPYGLAVNPVDGSVWYAATGMPGKIVRIDRGSNPPATCRTEVYEPPYQNPKAPDKVAFGPHGIDIDTNGIVWVALDGSSQLASFDRRKCKVRSAATAAGQECQEGWTLYPMPGPVLKGVTGPTEEAASADFIYFDWVDRFDILGLGKNVVIATGSDSDSLSVLNPDTGKCVILRIPYPLGFYPRGVDGRIDNPQKGWKDRGLWATYSEVPVWHIEGGKEATSMLMHIQLRPNPLAH
jgi:hypothetical protein